MSVTANVKQRDPSLQFRAITIALICIAAVPLLIFDDFKWLGWFLLSAAVVMAGVAYPSRFSNHMLLVVGALALLGIVPINTDISYEHMLIMGAILIGVVALPYVVSTFALHEKIITFPFRAGRAWYKREILYIGVAAAGAYLLLPYYLFDTGSFLNWSASLEPSSVARLFVGTNALGIWDEVFFVGVCLALFRQHLPFWWANVAQAALWTAFLYELGFQGWGVVVVFAFALSQGFIFKNTKSMLYIISVHLAIDFILFLVLLHLHNPDILRIFFTSPI